MGTGEETGIKNDSHGAADPLRTGRGRKRMRSAIRNEVWKMKMEGE
jgi:hypothetical protein